MSTPRPVRPGSRRPADESMSLLNEVIRHPVDALYGQPQPRPVSRAARITTSGLVLVVALALGVVLSGAVVELRAPRSAVQTSRTILTDRITARTVEADALRAGNDALAAEIAQLRDEALAAGDQKLLDDLARLELVSGAAAVQGPGLVLELADGPGDADDLDSEERVQDVDLQVLVNGLWAAGAEAVAINGVRLSALSPIRSAGQAIWVDLVPLASPYRVEAIGDVREMQTAFARSAAAGHLASLSANYQIAVTTRSAQDLVLPAASTTSLRYATAGDVASSADTSKKGTP